MAVFRRARGFDLLREDLCQCACVFIGRRAAVAVGSEGNGLSRELMAMCDGQVIIPMQPDSESLNAGVAASVIMWEMTR